MTSSTKILRISYKPLWKTLIDKGMRKQDLREQAKISASTIAKLGRNENVTTTVLVRICEALDCQIQEIIEVVPIIPHSQEQD